MIDQYNHITILFVNEFIYKNNIYKNNIDNIIFINKFRFIKIIFINIML